MSGSFPWLTVVGGLPILGSVVLTLMPKSADRAAKSVGMVFALLSFAAAVIVAFGYNAGGGMQFTEDFTWIGTFGIHYALGVDGIGLMLVLMTVLLTPVVLGAAWRDAGEGSPLNPGRSAKGYFALILLTEGLAVGVFEATDVFLFYVLFEATLVPLYFLIGSYGGANRARAALKFLIYSLAGGTILLAGVVGLYAVSAHAGQPSFLLSDLVQLHIGSNTQRALFVLFFIAFAIKAPMFPVHTWLPDSVAAGTSGTSVMLVGILDKLGTFGMLRFCLQLFPDASRWATPVVIVLALISIFYGAVQAVGAKELTRLIGYTSVSHFGVMVLGIFALTSRGQVGSTFYMVNHGLSTGALFLVVGYLTTRRRSDRIADFGGADKQVPVLSGLFLFIVMAGLALPGLGTFIGEFLSLAGTFERHVWAGVIGTISIILAALYMLLVYQRTMTGPVTENVKGMRDLSVREVAAVAPLVVLLLVLGLFPKPALDTITPAVQATMARVGVTDPSPTIPVSADEGQG